MGGAIFVEVIFSRPGLGSLIFHVASLTLASGESRPLVATPAEEPNAKLSPNGRWLAYVSNEGGRFDVYVQTMVDGNAKWLVSRGGGMQP